MSRIYAMSDIHGHYDLLRERVEQIKQLQISRVEESTADKILFLGDYIDEGPDGFQCLKLIRDLQNKFPGRVIVIKGNHEQWLLNYLDAKETWMGPDTELGTLVSFLTKEQLEQVGKYVAGGQSERVSLSETEAENILNTYSYIRKCIKENHGDLIGWLCELPLYYETDRQIFVHAGIDEEAEDTWMWGTSDDVFLNKFPETTGKFYKDIIAGHVGSATVSGDRDFHDVYYDGASHYYIDGTVHVSGHIPVLVFDEERGRYYSLQEDGTERLIPHS